MREAASTRELGAELSRGTRVLRIEPLPQVTALMYAAGWGHADVVRELMEMNVMDEIIMASPVVTDEVLLIRTLENLYAIAEATDEEGPAGSAR